VDVRKSGDVCGEAKAELIPELYLGSRGMLQFSLEAASANSQALGTKDQTMACRTSMKLAVVLLGRQ
jgi:hypothetical protein